MTNEELNKAIHEARGLCWHEWGFESPDWPSGYTQSTTFCKKCDYSLDGAYSAEHEDVAIEDAKEFVRLPDYCDDLNLTAELEETLMKLPSHFNSESDYYGPFYSDYYHALKELTNFDHDLNYGMITATARQRAEAFLMVMKKELS